MSIQNLKSSTQESANWKVLVNPRPYDWNVEVWFVQRQGSDAYLASIDKGQITLTLIKEGDATQKPTLIVPQEVWQLLSNAISETTPSVKKERIEGELESTKYHLEDLRKLLKLK